MNNFKKFSSKILLFGEHVINKGSNGLATPFQKYSCNLSFEKQKNTLKESRTVLELILNQIKKDDLLHSIFDIVSLEQDIYNDLKINMDIPVGYGLGSSGAICACIYDYYCHYKKESPKKIKNILGLIEGAFHGKSSGLDPLVSFFNKSILVSNEDTEIVDFEINDIADFKIFLVDTHSPRKTEPLVNKFLSKYEHKTEFSKKIDEELIPLTNLLINNFIKGVNKNDIKNIKKLSQLHLDIYKDFILKEHLTIWERALNKDDFYLKICGAGGGGFMIGFCENENLVYNYFNKEDITFV